MPRYRGPASLDADDALDLHDGDLGRRRARPSSVTAMSSQTVTDEQDEDAPPPTPTRDEGDPRRVRPPAAYSSSS